MRVPRFTSVNGFIANQNFLVQELPTGSDEGVSRSELFADKARLALLKNLARQLVTHLSLAFADAATLVVAVLAATVLGGMAIGDHPLLSAAILTVVMLISFASLGLYPGIGLTAAVELKSTTIVISIVLAAFGAACLAVASPSRILLNLCVLWMFLLVAIPLSRGLIRHLLGRTLWWGAPTIIVGSGGTGVSIFNSLRENPSWGLKPIGIIDDRLHDSAAAEAYCGNNSQLANLVKKHHVTWCIVALPDRPRAEVLRLVDSCAELIPHSLIVPDLAGLPSLWSGATDCGGFPGLRLKERLLMPIPVFSKRLMDFSFTLAILLAVAPLLLLLAVLVKLTSKGPVFYGQPRLGVGGNSFRAWKFRTMVSNADQVLAEYLAENEELRAEWERDHKLKNDPRVTFVGRLLRTTSLDELPQIWNVLRGEMSLVGPRPIVTAEIEKYGKCYELYQRVRPGITGLWQVSGRNNTTYEQRVLLDGYYVRNWSPWLDLCILLSTIRVVLLRHGAY
ncbi:undecaprenyl-phosphate galactose phosphotransferase WbaP [Planctomycetaceae bacterium SH139]